MLFTSACFLGCGGQAVEFREVKRLDEKVTQSELKRFLNIIDNLPDKTLPSMPPVFATPPEWNQARTLPVNELVEEEIKLLLERWSVEWLARNQQKSRRLNRALRREEISPQQFVGLSLAVGVALGRSTLRDNQDLDQVIKKGKEVIARLKRDSTAFHKLGPEIRYQVRQQAVWISRVDRASHLQLVPPENIALVREHWEELESIFPKEFTTNPLDSVADLLEEKGVPFEELSEIGGDEQISWSRDEALIGTDSPDFDSSQSL